MSGAGIYFVYIYIFFVVDHDASSHTNQQTVKWKYAAKEFSSVQISRSVVANSLWPHELQHARPPCLSQTPRVHPDSCPSSRWCHPAISSSVVPFSSFPQSLPASGSFPLSQLFAWGGLSIRVSASASVLPMNTKDWSPLGWTGWISLQSKGLSDGLVNRLFTTLSQHSALCAVLCELSESLGTWEGNRVRENDLFKVRQQFGSSLGTRSDFSYL